MKSKMNIKSIVIMAAVGITSLFFINMSLAANTAKVKVDVANLRETADENSKILEQLSTNKEVEIIEKNGAWYKVKANGITGYLREDLLTVNGNEGQENETTNTTTTTTENVADNQTPVTETTNTSVPEENKDEKRIIKENIKLKIVPVINATDIIEVKKDEEVEIIETVNGWVCVETQTAKGWIREEKLQKPEENKTVNTVQQEEPQQQNGNEAQPTVQTQEISKTLFVKETTVNLRKEANTTAEVLAKLSVNTAVTVTQEVNGWSKVTANGKEGYILSSLLDTKRQETSRSQASVRKTQQPTQTEQAKTNTASTTPAPTTTAVASGRGSTVVETARKYLGSKYVYGGSSPSGFDCSGFTSYVYKQHGVNLSRTAAAQSGNGVAVDKSNLQPGDLVFFGKSGIGHVGIYVGGGNFVHAANSSKGVITSTLNSGYYCNNYSCARRIM